MASKLDSFVKFIISTFAYNKVKNILGKRFFRNGVQLYRNITDYAFLRRDYEKFLDSRFIFLEISSSGKVNFYKSRSYHLAR
ncbi:hypothetical protein PGB90_005991 [Kerria lacca]